MTIRLEPAIRGHGAWLAIALLGVSACVEGGDSASTTDAGTGATGGGSPTGGTGAATTGGSGGGDETGGASGAGATGGEPTGGASGQGTGASSGQETGGTGGVETGGSGGQPTGGGSGTTTGGGSGDCDDPDAPDRPPQMGEVEVLYQVGETAATTQTIRATFKVQKTALGYLPLHLVSFRYWYTPDSVSNQTFECHYAEIGDANLTHTFGPDYIEIGFTASAGDLNPPGDTGEIQVAIHDAGYANSYDQSNDYSFDASLTSYAVNDRVTVYYCGQLVGGIEP